MATYTATRAGSTFPVAGAGPAGLAQVAVGVYDYATNLAATSIIELCKLPANACVYGGFLQASDLDTDATEELDIDIGWAAYGSENADPDGFGNFDVQNGDAVTNFRPVAGIWMPFINIIQNPGFKVFTSPATVIATVNVDAATFTAGKLKVVVNYIVDANFSA